MTDPPALRIATTDDAPAVKRIYAPFVDDTAVTFEREVPSVDALETRIGETLPTYPWLVCEREGVVVGYTYAGSVRKRAAYRWSVEVSVYVTGDARGRGVGRALYTALFALLVEQGYRNAFAVTTHSNVGRAFHEACGFEAVGTLPDAGYKLGEWHDVTWWQRRLRAPDGSPSPPRSLETLPATTIEEALHSGEARLHSP